VFSDDYSDIDFHIESLEYTDQGALPDDGNTADDDAYSSDEDDDEDINDVFTRERSHVLLEFSPQAQLSAETSSSACEDREAYNGPACTGTLADENFTSALSSPSSDDSSDSDQEAGGDLDISNGISEANDTTFPAVANVSEDLDVCYCDDLTLLAASVDPHEAELLLEQKLVVFIEFLDERCMQVADHKIKTMCIDPMKRDYIPTVRIRGKLIAVVFEHRFLGVFFDKDFAFVEHFGMIAESLTTRLKAMAKLRAAKWGPTIATLKVLHHSYVESRLRDGILAWYPHLSRQLKNRLHSMLLKSIRIVTSLSYHTSTVLLLAEADLDSLRDLARKAALSFYGRINPMYARQPTLAARLFKIATPKWYRLLRELPTTIWKGPIIQKLPDTIALLGEDKCVYLNTLTSAEETMTAEGKYTNLLYTDASVEAPKQLVSTRNLPYFDGSGTHGRACIAYIWYARDEAGNWQIVKEGSADIGNHHSSYSAESLAIQYGLYNDPWTSRHTPPETRRSARIALQPHIRGRATGLGAGFLLWQQQLDDLPIQTASDSPEREAADPKLCAPSLPRERTIGIFTDSLSNLMTLHGQIATSVDQLRLLRAIGNNRWPISVHHVKAHRTNEKNNRVDALCDVRSTNPAREHIPELIGERTSAAMKGWADRWLSLKRLECVPAERDKRQREHDRNPDTKSPSVSLTWYNNLSGGTLTNLSRPKFYDNLPRAQGVVLCRARTYKWTYCNSHMRAIREREDSLCETCNVEDTTDHVVDHCNLHARERDLLKQKLGHYGKISELLTSRDYGIIDAVSKFLVNVQDDRIERLKIEQITKLGKKQAQTGSAQASPLTSTALTVPRVPDATVSGAITEASANLLRTQSTPTLSALSVPSPLRTDPA
jgi:hypothetical protein